MFAFAKPALARWGGREAAVVAAGRRMEEEEAVSFAASAPRGAAHHAGQMRPPSWLSSASIHPKGQIALGGESQEGKKHTAEHQSPRIAPSPPPVAERDALELTGEGGSSKPGLGKAGGKIRAQGSPGQ